MTRYRPLPFRDRYHAASGTMVLPLAFDDLVSERLIYHVAGRVSAPLCQGWFRDIINELAPRATGAIVMSNIYASQLLRSNR